MRKPIVLPAFMLLCVFGAPYGGVAQSPDPLLGTWKANAERLTAAPGTQPARSNISVWEALADGQFKNTIETVNAKGQATRTEVITKFDGTESVVQGALVPTTRTYRRLDGRSSGSPIAWEYLVKVNGKVTGTYRTIASADARSRVAVSTGTNDQGQPFTNIQFYEKQ
jgi:hypothetical protein